jgi:Rrf2 family protein
MKITKRGEYALKALLVLCSVYDERTLSLREISEQEKLPLKFLEQIMMVVKRTGLVRSIKGKHGGYALARPPREITLGEIIRAVDGPLAPVGTAGEIARRIESGSGHPGLYSILLDVRNAISEILDKQTLADVCERSRELRLTKASGRMYYI